MESDKVIVSLSRKQQLSKQQLGYQSWTQTLQAFQKKEKEEATCEDPVNRKQHSYPKLMVRAYKMS